VQPVHARPRAAARPTLGGVTVVAAPAGETPQPTVPLTERSELGARLAGGDFITSVELTPPHGWDARELTTAALRLRAAGVHAVHVLERNRGASRMASVPAGIILAREPGIEPVVHYTCRDRNMPGMLSDLLGAAAAGVRNLLVLSGDPPTQGPYPDATVVFDIDSIGLINVLNGLNQGLDPGGASVGEPTRFVVGMSANPGALDLDREVDRFMYKVEAGADFAVTQPVFDAATLTRFLERTERWPVPVLAGVWPLTSLRTAEFLANEVPGVVVPNAVIERMRGAEERGGQEARAEGIRIARELVAAVRPHVRGVHVATPEGDVEAAIEVLAGV
jgi:5,10-methylenetetrahydrofolate reductase